MNKRWRAARAALLVTVLGTAAALMFSGAAAARPYLFADPPLTFLASVPLTTPSGTIQSVVYDGANTAVMAGATLPQTMSGFTVPAAPFTAKTTAVVADGQVSGNSLHFAGIPPGSYIARAYLFWGIINPNDPGGAMMIDGHSAASHLDGMSLSPCWPGPGSTQSIFDYSADVTPFVHGDGLYTLSGYPTGVTDGSDPWAHMNDNPFMEGA